MPMYLLKNLCQLDLLKDQLDILRIHYIATVLQKKLANSTLNICMK